MAEVKKPIPIPDGDSETFWQGCNEEKLLIQHCTDCGKHIYYPRAVCPHCMSDALEWVESSGKGKVYSYTIARRGAGPAFAEDAPYVVALIDLDEGVRMLSNIINIDVDEVRCDMPVEVVFEQVGDMKLPKFQPVNR
jgi:hypothetical protein